MERRWWLLGAVLVIAVAAGFGIGSAVKSTSAPAPAPAGSLASGNAATGAEATVTRPGASVAVPSLRPARAQGDPHDHVDVGQRHDRRGGHEHDRDADRDHAPAEPHDGVAHHAAEHHLGRRWRRWRRCGRRRWLA